MVGNVFRNLPLGLGRPIDSFNRNQYSENFTYTILKAELTQHSLRHPPEWSALQEMLASAASTMWEKPRKTSFLDLLQWQRAVFAKAVPLASHQPVLTPAKQPGEISAAVGAGALQQSDRQRRPLLAVGLCLSCQNADL